MTAVREHLKTTADGYGRFNGELIAGFQSPETLIGWIFEQT